MTAAELPVTFASGKEEVAAKSIYTHESEEEKCVRRIGLYGNMDVRCTYGGSNLWVLEPKIRFSPRRHCVAAESYVLFIQPWKKMSQRGMSHAGIYIYTYIYVVIMRGNVRLLVNYEFIRLIISTRIDRS